MTEEEVAQLNAETITRLFNEERDLATRQLCMRFGSVLVSGMYQSNMTFADIDHNLEVKSGTTKRVILRLLDGKDVWLSHAGSIAHAMGFKCELTLKPLDQ